MTTEDKEGRHGRSVRLTTSVNNRLIELCEHLGVTPNAYLLGAIGKAISTDEVLLIPHRNAANMQNLVKEAHAEQQQSLLTDQDS